MGAIIADAGMQAVIPSRRSRKVPIPHELVGEMVRSRAVAEEAPIAPLRRAAVIFNPAKVLPEGSRCFDFGGVRREIPEGAWI